MPGRIRTVAAVVLASAVLPACSLAAGQREDPRAAATQAGSDFLEDWAVGRLDEAGRRTDAPPAATQALTQLTEDLRVTSTRLEPRDATGCAEQQPCTLPFTATLGLETLGEWRYDSALELVRREQGWQVRWAPSVLHPQLAADTRLRRVREVPDRAPVLDRDGRALVEQRPVVTVGIEPRSLVEPERVYRTLGSVLGVDADKLRERVDAAEEDALVEAVTLREADFEDVRRRLDGLPGVVSRRGEQALAPTRGFARGVLGVVTPATPETLATAGPTASPADRIGSSGLQATFQQQLAGRPGGRVELVARDGGAVRTVLQTWAPERGSPLRTTLDYEVQEAAEAALSGVSKAAALVAVQPSTGEVLAAANGPEGSEAYNRAFIGQYPPGSTFKIITSSALLRGGLRVDEPVDCPQFATVEGKRFKNAELFELGTVPFRTAFARSCNTSFLALRDRVAGETLPREAAAYGVGAVWDLGVDAYSGSVPAPRTEVDLAATVIGQSRVLLSPLGVAMVSAAVASGQPRTPMLVRDRPGAPVGEPLPEPVAAALRELMREVVTDGSGTALRVAGPDVAAKTGTAEYGGDDPPRTHAWITGFRGDLAFAVVLEDGGFGGRNAGPVAARFLAALPNASTP